MTEGFRNTYDKDSMRGYLVFLRKQYAAFGIGWPVVATVAVVLAGFATPPLEAGLRALWPSVLNGPAEVQAAYALDAAAQEVLFTVGPLLVIAATAVSTGAALLLTG